MARTTKAYAKGPGWYVDRVVGTIAGPFVDTIDGPFESDAGALARLHQLTSCSWDHAIRYEGWIVKRVDADGNELDRVRSYSKGA